MRIARAAADGGCRGAPLWHRCRSCRHRRENRVFSAPDLKAVQVVIAPTEGDLQCLVELRYRAVGPDEKPPPYQRADAAQEHPQLKDLRFRTTRFHHLASLLLCAAHPQLSVGLGSCHGFYVSGGDTSPRRPGFRKFGTPRRLPLTFQRLW